MENAIIQIFTLVLGGVCIRTLGAHLQAWQIREYRVDRMKDWTFNTEDGRKFLTSLWFFREIFPRPKITFRIFVILIIATSIYVFFWNKISNTIPFWILLLGIERSLFLGVGVSVFISKFPFFIAEEILFSKARKIIQASNENVVRIGITGSFGKSSTKEMLVHVLQENFGTSNVLFTPENQNQEISIARLILKNKKFFEKKSKQKKFFVVEMGAYRKREIAKMCSFVYPEFGILTGITNQHQSLFGSFENIVSAKFELAQNCSNMIFYNADSPALEKIFQKQPIEARVKKISRNFAHNIKGDILQTTFELYLKKFTLPWAGDFFVINALLVIYLSRELGIKIKDILRALETLTAHKKTFFVRLHKKYTLIENLYSANPEGVFSAIEYLKKFRGKKVLISLPLRELGKDSQKIHLQIFKALKEANVELFWMKPDFEVDAKKILGKKFHTDIEEFQKMEKNFAKNDVVMLLSRIPKAVQDLFLKEKIE